MSEDIKKTFEKTAKAMKQFGFSIEKLAKCSRWIIIDYSVSKTPMIDNIIGYSLITIPYSFLVGFIIWGLLR